MVRFFRSKKRSKKILKDRDRKVEFVKNMSFPNLFGKYEVYVPETSERDEKFKKFEEIFKKMDKEEIRLKNELDKILERKRKAKKNGKELEEEKLLMELRDLLNDINVDVDDDTKQLIKRVVDDIIRTESYPYKYSVINTFINALKSRKNVSANKNKLNSNTIYNNKQK